MARKLCIVCNIRQARTQDGITDLCRSCYEYAGWENTHSDEGHDADGVEEHPECLVCQDKDPAETAVARQGHHSPRRKQLNHRRDCKHAQTPAARRACREAHWADPKGDEIVMVAYDPNDNEGGPS
jgi:hypothetical protein